MAQPINPYVAGKPVKGTEMFFGRADVFDGQRRLVAEQVPRHGGQRMAEQLLEFDLDLYALDYAESEALAAFAARRARQFSLHSFVSDRALSRV
jgi:hypothetical protein